MNQKIYGAIVKTGKMLVEGKKLYDSEFKFYQRKKKITLLKV